MANLSLWVVIHSRGYGLCPRDLLTHLIWVIALFALFVGACEILMARKVRRYLRDERFLVLAGAGSLIFGGFLLQGRAFSDNALLVWLGFYASFSAVTMSGLAFRLWRARALPSTVFHAA